jgi:hypothetical protein
MGADARAVLWRGETADGRGYAVKTSSAPQPGLVVADFLASRGVRGVPPPGGRRPVTGRPGQDHLSEAGAAR